MHADAESKTIYLTPSDKGPILCPVCQKLYKPNGTGPANSPLEARLLKYLPSEHILGGFAPYCHDVGYLLCPEGWKVVCNYGIHRVIMVDKKTADDGYEELMKVQTRHRAGPITRWWYLLMAERNAEAVRLLGDSSYCHKH